MKTLASWVCLLQSCRLAIGPLVSIMCLSLYDAIKHAPYWSSCITLSDLCVQQLKWWLIELPNLTEYDICPSPTITKFEFSIASDAGSKGYFVYKLLVKCRVISQPFTPAEAKESSTFRELTAVHETWNNEVVLVEFEGQTVGHYTHNKAVM